jgi:hypothetical protein
MKQACLVERNWEDVIPDMALHIYGAIVVCGVFFRVGQQLSMW